MVLIAQNIFAKIIIDNANYQSKIIKLNSTKNPKITRAWVETEFKEEKNRSTVLYEIDCEQEKFRRLGGVMYKEVTGDPIAMEPTKEEYIIPNTNLDTLKREVCTGKY